MKHSEGFLRLVNDAKSRIQEVTVAETIERLNENPDAKLWMCARTMNGKRLMLPGRFISAKA